MKLRLKNIDTNETLKITVADTCTITQLKQTILNNLSINRYIYLSLNRKDQIPANSDTDSLKSIGIVSGDRIFFSVYDYSFVRSQTLVFETLDSENMIVGSSSSVNKLENDLIVENKLENDLIVENKLENDLIVENKLENDLIVENYELGRKETLENSKIMQNYETGDKETLENDKVMEIYEMGSNKTVEKSKIMQNYESCSKETVGSSVVEKEALVVKSDSGKKISRNYEKESISSESDRKKARESLIVDSNSEKNFKESSRIESLESDIQMEDIDFQRNRENLGENMDVDDQEDGENKIGLSVPGFLRKVFNKEFGDNGGCDHKLVVIAVHAVLMESGFVTFDPVSKTKLDGFCLLSTRSLCYTLVEIVESSGVVESVVVKVQSLGKDVIFYGSLAGKSLGTYRVRFDGERLAIVLNLMWANVDSDVERSGLVVCPEKEVLEFWKTVKDKLWLPLLSDLCEVANLPPPPNFTRLPTDMKLMILELLPGVDLAKTTCVSRELQFLSSNDGLWKQKYLEQYGDAEASNGSVVESSWKRKFVKAWQARKRSMRIDMVPGQPFRARRIIRPLPLFGNPRIIGGHHDLYPNMPGIYYGDHDLTPNIGIGGLPLGGNRGRNFMRNFAPQCNFGNRNM